MAYYVVKANRRLYATHMPDWRTARILSAHRDRDTADRMADGMRRHERFDRLYGVYTGHELPTRLRKQVAV